MRGNSLFKENDPVYKLLEDWSPPTINRKQNSRDVSLSPKKKRLMV